MEFCEASTFFHKSMTKKERAEEGIFFTPKKVRSRMFEKLTELNVNPRLVLEPSFGTGEFMVDASQKYPEAKLVGVEKNPDLFQSYPSTTTYCEDFLTWTHPEKADLILGNPPYFVMKGKEKYPCMTGRPNIYVLFLYKCLTQHLASNGTLAFVLPTSLYNSAYYQPMRDYLYAHTTICHLENLTKPGFYETTQDTMLLILQLKEGFPKDYFFFYKQTYLSPYSKELTELVRHSTTISDLGLGVKTGNVVWNQHKDALADEGTLLIYSSNIHEGKLVFPVLKTPKKQYIQLDKPLLEGPNLLVERGYGNGYLFQYALIHEPCYAENHVNVIYPRTPDSSAHLDRVVKSFQDPRTTQFLKYFIGNGSLSATELETLFPIFV
jgi:hypothetical protein